MFTLNKSSNRESQATTVKKSLEVIEKRLKKTEDPGLNQGEIITWIKQVFEKSVKLSQQELFESDPPAALTLPKEISAYVVQSVIRIITAENDPNDSSLYFLNETGLALGINPGEMRNLLDREFDDLRYDFTLQLRKELDANQLYWCALILMKIICADGQIHPAEKLYFNLIKELIKGSEHSLESLKKTALEVSDIPRLKLNPALAVSMLKYVVTIAMCDGEYVGQESEFIKKAADSLGIETSQIDTILQPVASSFMVLESLFPRKS